MASYILSGEGILLQYVLPGSIDLPRAVVPAPKLLHHVSCVLDSEILRPYARFETARVSDGESQTSLVWRKLLTRVASNDSGPLRPSSMFDGN